MERLPLKYPFDSLAGLIETSIGKMVPIMTSAELEKDQLMVYAEPYNTLILDGKGFKTKIPDIKGLAPKDNIKAWVDRKALIDNLGHATAAYFGYYQHPEAVYLYEVLDDKGVFSFTRDVMLQSSLILSSLYPDDFSINELEEHIDDLMGRFRSRYLRDTIYRVGNDLRRKLSVDDRFMGIIHHALHSGKPYDKILKAMSYGFCFAAKGENGTIFHPDIKFLDELSGDFESTVIRVLNFDPVSDKILIEELMNLYRELKP
jgi:mannitol-1-phosphate 5-dehydrogenase